MLCEDAGDISMDVDKCSYRYKALIAMFVLCFSSLIMFWGAIIYSANINKDDIVLNMIVAAGLLLLMLFTIGFLVFTGMLASILNRSLMKWVGGSFLAMHLLPMIGLIGAFVVIRGQIKDSDCLKESAEPGGNRQGGA